MGGKPFVGKGLDRRGYRPILKTLSGEKGSELAPGPILAGWVVWRWPRRGK